MQQVANAMSSTYNAAVSILSKPTNNRRDYFELLTMLEASSGITDIDAGLLTGIIDGEYPGRESVTREEAQAMITAWLEKDK